MTALINGLPAPVAARAGDYTKRGDAQQDPSAWRREMEQAQMQAWLSHGALPASAALPAAAAHAARAPALPAETASPVRTREQEPRAQDETRAIPAADVTDHSGNDRVAMPASGRVPTPFDAAHRVEDEASGTVQDALVPGPQLDALRLHPAQAAQPVQFVQDISPVAAAGVVASHAAQPLKQVIDPASAVAVTAQPRQPAQPATAQPESVQPESARPGYTAQPRLPRESEDPERPLSAWNSGDLGSRLRGNDGWGGAAASGAGADFNPAGLPLPIQATVISQTSGGTVESPVNTMAAKPATTLPQERIEQHADLAPKELPAPMGTSVPAPVQHLQQSLAAAFSGPGQVEITHSAGNMSAEVPTLAHLQGGPHAAPQSAAQVLPAQPSLPFTAAVRAMETVAPITVAAATARTVAAVPLAAMPNAFAPDADAAPVVPPRGSQRSAFMAPVSRASTRQTATPEPIRVHADWSADGVRIWLGVDASAQPTLPAVREQLQRWIAAQGFKLLSLACNGEDITDSDSPIAGAYEGTGALPSRISNRLITRERS